MSDDKKSFEQLVISDLGGIKEGIAHLRSSFEDHLRDDASNFASINTKVDAVQTTQNERKFMLRGISKVAAWVGGGLGVVATCMGIIWVGLNIMEKLNG